jgi:hypothetical protein
MSIFEETDTNINDFNDYIKSLSNKKEIDIGNDKYYKYNALDLLSQDYHEIQKNDINSIVLCIYSINNQGKFPFLEFGMTKNTNRFLINNELFSMPSFIYDYESDIFNQSKIILDNLFYLELNNSKLEKFNYDYKGYLIDDNKLYLFIDCSKLNNQIRQLNRNTNLWFLLADEIVNHKKSCNFQINKETTDFFIKNINFLFINDEENKEYEIPIVAYVGKPLHNLEFTAVFGQIKLNEEQYYGPYYYFTDYKTSIRQGGWTKDYNLEIKYNKLITEKNNGKYLKGGIIKFALFLGKTKFIQEKEDKVDNNWTKNYDSLYVNKIYDELKLDTEKEKYPMWILKDYNQQVSLSYNYIDRRTLGNIWDGNNENYYVM